METYHKKIIHCLHCKSEDIEYFANTEHGYPRYKCRDCNKTFNQRTGTPFNRLEIPTDVALQVVRWYLQYKLSLRDLAKIFQERGIIFTHETVRNWEKKFTPLIIKELRRRRYAKAGNSWYIDETVIYVKGKQCYL